MADKDLKQNVVDETKENEEHPTVTPEGGSDTKRPADKDVKEFFKLFDGQELSEDFKTNASTIFEAAVARKAADLQEEFDEKLEAEKAKLAEEAEESKKTFVEETQGNVDKYLSYVAEAWAEENKVAIEAAYKVEVAEQVIEGLKDLAGKFNLKLSEEQEDALEISEEAHNEISDRYTKLFEDYVALKEEKEELEKTIAIASVTESMSMNDIEKFKALAEQITFTSPNEFNEKLVTIRNTYFAESTKKGADLSEDVEDNVDLKEELQEIDESISHYVQALSKK